jgi:hypothetical protein
LQDFERMNFFGRVAPGITPWRSHRSGRAPLRASGSSTGGLAVRPSHLRRGRPYTPDAIRQGCGDRFGSLEVLRLVPPAGSACRQCPSLHRVLRGEFPGFDGTMALCDFLCPSRPTRLPSPSDTLHRRREATRTSQVPGKPRLLLCQVLRLRQDRMPPLP